MNELHARGPPTTEAGMSVMNVDYYADRPKLARNLPFMRTEKQQARHLSFNSFFVFWLLFLVMMFCAPALAQPAIDGRVCFTAGERTTQQEPGYDGIIRTWVCTCTPDPDSIGAINNWECEVQTIRVPLFPESDNPYY